MGEKTDVVKDVITTMTKNNDKKRDMTRTTGIGTGLRFNEGKLRYDLVHPKAHHDMVEVLTDGANKYFSRNWENGLSWTSVLASLKRHIAAIERGEDRDPESGRLHIAHAACNVHFLNAFYYIFPQGDDRPKPFLKLPKIGLDIDGVIADFQGAWNKIHPDVKARPYNWSYDRDISKRFKTMEKKGTLDDFYLNNVQPLIKSEELPFEPHCYITSRPVSTKITEEWLKKHNFPARPVYTVPLGESKADIALAQGITIFIDDSYRNFVDLNNVGVFTYLYEATWNIKYDIGHMRIKSLKELPVLT